jgi:hypothetical protein
MEASRSFYDYAKSHSPRKFDFDSYCQRLGGLNAWRIPLYESQFNRRFEELAELLKCTIRPSIERASSEACWSEFQKSFSQHLSSTVKAWEMHHLSASFAA